MKASRKETFVAQSEIPSSGPALLFDAEGDVAEALVQALLDEAHCVSREPESFVFIVQGGLCCRLVFTEPVPMPLIQALIRQLGGGALKPTRLEQLNLRPLLRMNAAGFSLFTRPVSAGAEA
jgi:hypothetical protein